MRTRSRVSTPESIYSSMTRTSQYLSQPTKVVLENTGSWSLTGGETMVDQVNPGYFRAEREGGLKPVSPMSKTKSSYLLVPGAAHQLLTGNGFTYVHQCTGALVSASAHSWLANLKNHPADPSASTKPALLQQALARAQTDAWDTATFLAEFGKTVEMLTTFYGRWRETSQKVLNAARKKKRLGENLGEAFSNAWLEGRYGVRPLVYDMMDIHEAYNRVTQGVESPLSRGWAQEEVSPNHASNVGQTTAYAYARGGSFDSPTLQSYSGRGTAMQWIALLSKERRLRATVGVSVTTRVATQFDLAVTAWEIVPYSFIADWFINICDLIAAWSPFATGYFRYATFTDEVIFTRTATTLPVWVNPGSGWTSVVTGQPSQLSFIETKLARTLETPSPSLQFRVNLNASKIVDLIALAFGFRRDFKLLLRRG